MFSPCSHLPRTAGADLGGGEGAASPLSSGYHFLRYLSSSGVSKNSELAQFCCSQTVKSNILLSQNAGNAISETLDVQNFPGGGMTLDAHPPPPPSRARASPSNDRYAVTHEPHNTSYVPASCIVLLKRQLNAEHKRVLYSSPALSAVTLEKNRCCVFFTRSCKGGYPSSTKHR